MPTLDEATEEHMNERSGVWMNKIFCEDCLEGLMRMPDNMVDFMFTDPPYNVGKDYGIYKDNLNETEYIGFMTKVISECKRISSNGIAFLVGGLYIKKFWDMIPDAKLIVIHKRAIGPRKGGFFLQHYGLLVGRNPIKSCKDVWNDVRLVGEGYYFREPTYGHPAMTSLALTLKIIEYFTEGGEIVLDPFMGVGTTAVACKKLGRNYVGFEINPSYMEISEDRLSNTIKLVDVVEWFR